MERRARDDDGGSSVVPELERPASDSEGGSHVVPKVERRDRGKTKTRQEKGAKRGIRQTHRSLQT